MATVRENRVLGAVSIGENQSDDTPRVLGAVRQSKTRDKALSPEAQRKRINAWKDDNDGTLVKFTTDLSTSGGKSAFRRKGLGPWLTDPEKIKTWDVLVVTRLDRACRDVADYLKLSTWCDRNGKRFIVLDDPSLDTSTPGGRAMGTMRATFAQYELEMTRERNRETRREQNELGNWPGGRVNYGWRYDSDAQQLVPDSGRTAEVLHTMADMSIAGKSDGQITEWLNGGNGSICYLTMIRKSWTQDTVRRVLRHPKTAELLGETKAAELRAARRNREQTRGERTNGHMLLRVAFCGRCVQPLYAQVKRDRPSGGYYRCLKCNLRMRMDWLENDATRFVTQELGGYERIKMELVPGDDHQVKIHTLEREIDVLKGVTGAEMLITAKQAEIEHWRSEPFEPDHYEPRGQGVAIAAYWEALGKRSNANQERGMFLRQQGIKVTVDPTTREWAWACEAYGVVSTSHGTYVQHPEVMTLVPLTGH
jgi:DNA invertase Pin-like site-specific DNA recombinase